MQQQQQQTVIINAGMPATQGAPQNIRPFSTGLCGCFEDCGGCIFAYFLFPCYVCSLAGRMGESCCVPFVQGGMLGMRTKIRTQFGIQGSICDDWCCTTFCNELAMCQLDREMKHCGL